MDITLRISSQTSCNEGGFTKKKKKKKEGTKLPSVHVNQTITPIFDIQTLKKENIGRIK